MCQMELATPTKIRLTGADAKAFLPCFFLAVALIFVVISDVGMDQYLLIKGSLGGETSVLRTFRMSGKELVKERVSKERVRQGKS